jgi:hypothetical protein
MLTGFFIYVVLIQPNRLGSGFLACYYLKQVDSTGMNR